MKYEVVREEGLRILRPEEDVIDLNNIEDFRDFLEEHAKSCDDDVILDLGGISYIGSVGLGMISLVGIMLGKEKRAFVIVAERDDIVRLFHISGLYRVLKIVDGLDAARRHLGRGGS